MAAFETLRKSHPLLKGETRPEAMAIGDSIFNGVRSAGINGRLARWSPPAQVARDRGWRMRLPDYPQPVLFDLEQELRDGIDFKRIREHLLANAQRWMDAGGAWSTAPFFDNISIAGAAYADLHDTTAGAAKEKIPGLLAKIRASEGLDFASIALLWFNLNIAFLLNPSGHPDLDDLTPLEQVATRSPKRLLINIGSNEGLFRIGLMANYSRENLKTLNEVPKLARKLAKTIAERCPDVERVYFNLLVRPRALANLAPREDADMYEYPGDGYFERYVGRLAMLNGMSDEQMEAFDRAMQKVNDKTKTAMSAELGDRIRFVDTFAMSTAFDGKHYGNARMVEVEAGSRRLRLSNMPFSAGIFGFRQGGLFGLDNMHPTQAGYALMAGAMVDAIRDAEGGPPSSVSVQNAFDADSLLQDPPSSWDSLNLLMSLISDLGLARV